MLKDIHFNKYRSIDNISLIPKMMHDGKGRGHRLCPFPSHNASNCILIINKDNKTYHISMPRCFYKLLLVEM